MKIISEILLEEYKKNFPQGLEDKFAALQDAEISNESFSLYTSVSVMASSKIEGEALEIDSYVKHKMLNIEYLIDLVEKPNDLYKAYIFAQKNKLTLNNFFKAHEIISEHLLPEIKRGVYRNSNMVVMEHKTFKIQYEAALSNEVPRLMRLFWDDLEHLIRKELTFQKYFISPLLSTLILLIFIHSRMVTDVQEDFLKNGFSRKSWARKPGLFRVN